jgi:pilus assembly protein Flp/PilA
LLTYKFNLLERILQYELIVAIDQKIKRIKKQPCPGATTMKNLFSRFANDESGATAIEYGLIAALVSVVIIASLTAMGTQLTAVFTGISTKLVAP